MEPPPRCASLGWRPSPGFSSAWRDPRASGLAYSIFRVFPPKPYFQSDEHARPAYNTVPMQLAVDPVVEQQQAALLKFGSRFLGQPGTQKAGEYIEAAFKKAGWR